LLAGFFVFGGDPMLSATKIAEVKRLLALNRPHRKIAAEVGLSHSTVDAIAKGKRPDPVERVQSQNYPFPMDHATVRARAREMLIANGREKSFAGATP
jgi:hypothetical protein